jgi:hypothetical protein
VTANFFLKSDNSPPKKKIENNLRVTATLGVLSNIFSNGCSFKCYLVGHELGIPATASARMT